MPADDPPYIPSLVEVGPRVFNLVYLIVSDKVGEPARRDLVEVTMVPGTRYRLEGDDATWWLSALDRFIPPENRQVTPHVGRTEVRHKKNRAAENLGE